MNEFPGQFDRRTFITGAGASAIALALPVLPAEAVSTQDSIIVSPSGADDAPGSLAHPIRSLDRALALGRSVGRSTILLRAGTHELTQPLHITAGNAPLRISNYAREEPILSGGTRLQLDWRPFRDEIFQATVPSGTTTDQLFINNRRQVLARYPNFDPNARYLNGFSADAIGPARVARWNNPAGGYIHALQHSLWGSLHYRITGKDVNNTLHCEGGWQINSGNQPMHKEYLFVENIFEELDAPGEWFLDEQSSTLYFYPPADLDLGTLAAQQAPASFRAVNVSHITVKVPDLHRTSKFYQEFFGMPLRQQSATTHILGVGNSFFGIEQGDNPHASVDHYDFGIENFNADAIRAKLTELNLKFSGTSQESFKFNDPHGFLIQLNDPDYSGHV